MTVDVKGIPELEAALERVKRDVAAMPAAHESAGRLLADAISSRTPVRTGRLAASWTVMPGPDRVTVASRELYAAPVEYGTARMAGAHMAERALLETEAAIGETYERSIADVARGAGFGVE